MIEILTEAEFEALDPDDLVMRRMELEERITNGPYDGCPAKDVLTELVRVNQALDVEFQA